MKPNPKIDDRIKDNQGKYFCKCGCGMEINSIIYSNKTIYIPKYIKGHNNWIKKNKILKFCQCGCNQLIKPSSTYYLSKMIPEHRKNLTLINKRKYDILRKKRRYENDIKFREKVLEKHRIYQKRNKIYFTNYRYKNRYRCRALNMVWRWGINDYSENYLQLLIEYHKAKEAINEFTNNSKRN